MPISVNSDTFQGIVYSKAEIDLILNYKADKVLNVVNNNDIALLRGTDGNLVDSGVTIEDIEFSNPLDNGTF